MDKVTLHEAIQVAITAEQNGQKFYTEMAGKFSDNGEVADTFARLANDEKMHEAQFRKLLEGVGADGAATTDEKADLFLRATAMAPPSAKKAFEDAGGIATAEDALLAALDFEKASAAYYGALAEVMGSSPQLDEIIQAEKEHVVALMKVILTDAKFRSLQDTWT